MADDFYTSGLCATLLKYSQTGHQCDMYIITEDDRVSVHSIVLAASLNQQLGMQEFNYKNVMPAGNMKSLDMSDFKTEDVLLAVQYIYTGVASGGRSEAVCAIWDRIQKMLIKVKDEDDFNTDAVSAVDDVMKISPAECELSENDRMMTTESSSTSEIGICSKTCQDISNGDNSKEAYLYFKQRKDLCSKKCTKLRKLWNARHDVLRNSQKDQSTKLVESTSIHSGLKEGSQDVEMTIRSGSSFSMIDAELSVEKEDVPQMAGVIVVEPKIFDAEEEEVGEVAKSSKSSSNRTNLCSARLRTCNTNFPPWQPSSRNNVRVDGVDDGTSTFSPYQMNVKSISGTSDSFSESLCPKLPLCQLPPRLQRLHYMTSLMNGTATPPMLHPSSEKLSVKEIEDVTSFDQLKLQMLPPEDEDAVRNLIPSSEILARLRDNVVASFNPEVRDFAAIQTVAPEAFELKSRSEVVDPSQCSTTSDVHRYDNEIVEMAEKFPENNDAIIIDSPKTSAASSHSLEMLCVNTQDLKVQQARKKNKQKFEHKMMRMQKIKEKNRQQSTISEYVGSYEFQPNQNSPECIASAVEVKSEPETLNCELSDYLVQNSSKSSKKNSKRKSTPAQSRPSQRRRMVSYTAEMEKEVVEWYHQQMAQGCSLTRKDLRKYASNLQSTYPAHNFRASANWNKGILQRNSLQFKEDRPLPDCVKYFDK